MQHSAVSVIAAEQEFLCLWGFFARADDMGDMPSDLL
jgi:hypothetical protein